MSTLRIVALAALVAGFAGACTPDRAMDFGPPGEITTAPEDEVSRKIMREFDGHSFQLGPNDREAEVRLKDWPAGYHLLVPFWLGVNPVFPFFLRPRVGRIYVISEAILVRSLQGDNRYLIRAGSRMFKADAVFAATNTHYTGPGKMLPTVVRFVGTAVITVPKDPPATGTVTEKVAVLRETSLPMQVIKRPPEYASFEVRGGS